MNQRKALQQELQKAQKAVEALDIAFARDNKESMRIEGEKLKDAIQAIKQLHEDVDRTLKSYLLWMGK